VTAFFGTLAAALTLVFAWPQALRAWRHDGGAGISLTTVALMLQSGLLWTAYGVLVDSAFITIANGSVAAAALVIALACRRRLGRARGIALALGAPAVTTIAIALGPPVVGVLGVACAGLMTLPQLALALRRGTVLTALSPVTFALLATNAACWIVYGVGLGDALVVAPNLVTLPASVVILWRRVRARAHA